MAFFFSGSLISGDAALRISSRSRGVGVTKAAIRGLSRPAIAATVKAIVVETALKASVKGFLKTVVAAIARELATAATAGKVAGGERAARRLRQIEAMAKAIIDSGASSDFGGRDLELDNAVPGEALVSLANDVQERVEEKGDVFPLEDVRKVSSFPRPLVSVRKLVEKHESVLFDDAGVHVRTSCSGGQRCVDGMRTTKIGELGSDMLYNFDLRALARHARCAG